MLSCVETEHMLSSSKILTVSFGDESCGSYFVISGGSWRYVLKEVRTIVFSVRYSSMVCFKFIDSETGLLTFKQQI